eukprot:10462034-Lingulodinium_polyedra.AAC.1
MDRLAEGVLVRLMQIPQQGNGGAVAWAARPSPVSVAAVAGRPSGRRGRGELAGRGPVVAGP